MKGIARAIGIFTVGAFLLAFLGFPLQERWGAWGLAATELITLLVALIGMKAVGLKARQTFRLRPIDGRQAAGFFLLYIAGQNLATALTAITALLSPAVEQRLGEVAQAIDMPLLPAVVVVAILPAICEEALFRGVLRQCFSAMPPMVAAVMLGLMFGAFHLDLYRLVPTAVLGIAISYLVIKTDNFLWGFLYHFCNNLTVVLQKGGGQFNILMLPMMAVVGVGCWILAARILTKEGR